MAASAERFCVEQYAITRLLRSGIACSMRVSRWPRGTWIGAGDVALLELLLLADVEDHGRLVGAAVRARGGRAISLTSRGIELLDPGAGVLDQLLA